MDAGVLTVLGFFLAGIAVGALIGRAWALALPALPVLLFIPAGRDSDGAPHFVWAAILYAIPLLLGILIGLLVRKAVGHTKVSGRPRRPVRG
jgi:hypothetical protein